LQPDRPRRRGCRARWAVSPDAAPGNGRRPVEFGGGTPMNVGETPVGVAVLGLGNVGSQVVRIIQDSAADLRARIGAPLELRGVGVRRVADDRGVPIEMLTDDVEALVSRNDVDIVVELMGPVEPARKAILGALERGKSVVTANKALLAQST